MAYNGPRPRLDSTKALGSQGLRPATARVAPVRFREGTAEEAASSRPGQFQRNTGPGPEGLKGVKDEIC